MTFYNAKFAVPLGLLGYCTCLGSAAHAQIIHSSDHFDESPSAAVAIHPMLFSRESYTMNPLSLTNLPGDLRESTRGEIFLQNGGAISAEAPLTGSLTAFASADAYHVAFTRSKFLNFVGLDAFVGVSQVVAKRIEIHALGTCTSERTLSHLKQFYGSCGPHAGVIIVPTGTMAAGHLAIGADAGYSFGRVNLYAKYGEASAFIEGAVGTTRTKFQLRLAGSYRKYSVPTDFQALGGDRRDYRIEATARFEHSSKRLRFGLEAEPYINWSSLPQYRYWDLRAGPFVEMEF